MLKHVPLCNVPVIPEKQAAFRRHGSADMIDHSEAASAQWRLSLRKLEHGVGNDARITLLVFSVLSTRISFERKLL